MRQTKWLGRRDVPPSALEKSRILQNGFYARRTCHLPQTIREHTPTGTLLMAHRPSSARERLFLLYHYERNARNCSTSA